MTIFLALSTVEIEIETALRVGREKLNGIRLQRERLNH